MGLLMEQGIWILAIMIYTARYEAVLVPYMEFPNWQFCNAHKAYMSRELQLPLVCTQERGA